MIKPEDVTIIIPHFGADKNQCNALSMCLKSLAETVPEIKIVVVKNGPTACFCQRAIRVVGQGQCKAVNAGVAITNTPWIFITNDDMIFAEDWFARLTDHRDEDQPFCVSPQLVEPRPGAPTFQVKFFGGADGDFNYEEWRKFADDYMENGEGELRTGFNLPFLIKRDLWDLIGGYNIKYDPWGSNSDSDLEYKIKLAGVQPMQDTNSIVYHFSQTSGTFNPENTSYWHRNFAVFKEIWGFDRTDDGIWEANFKIPTKEEGRIYNPSFEGKYL